MIWLCVVAFGVTALAAAFIVRWARDHARVYGQGMPQRFHVGHVPRLGGAALLLGMFKLQWIKRGTDLILAELMLFFIPCLVGLIKYQHLFVTQGWQLIVSVVTGTVCVMAVTAYAVHLGFNLEARLKQNSQGRKNRHPSGSKMAHGE